MTSPTARTLSFLCKQGWTAHVVEHFNSFTKRRHDFAGWADILAYRADNKGVLGVQTTTRGNMNARLAKMKAEPNLAVWLAAGNAAQAHGWKKSGPRGKRKTWNVVVEPVTAMQMEAR